MVHIVVPEKLKTVSHEGTEIQSGVVMLGTPGHIALQTQLWGLGVKHLFDPKIFLPQILFRHLNLYEPFIMFINF